MAHGLPNGNRPGLDESHYWDLAHAELRSALSILSDLAQIDTRSVPYSLVRAALQGVHDRLMAARELIKKAQDDDRHQG